MLHEPPSGALAQKPMLWLGPWWQEAEAAMGMSDGAIGIGDVRDARAVIAGTAIRTPLVPAPSLTRLAGSEVLLKLETVQPVKAFKIRGAANAILRLDPSRTKGVACASTGNHGRAVAYAARARGIKAVICLSKLVPDNKVKAIEALGAEARRIGSDQDEAMREVERITAEDGWLDVPPFDHPHVVAGQGTIGLELLEDRPDLGAILVPLSGGGLAGGIALAAKALKPSIRVIGISMKRGAAMAESIKAGRPVEVAELPTLADSLGGGIGLDNRWTFALCRDLLDDVVLLSEEEIYRGMAHLMREERVIAEGGASVGAAAILAGRVSLRGPTALVVSGANMSLDQLGRIAAGQPVRVGDSEIHG